MTSSTPTRRTIKKGTRGRTCPETSKPDSTASALPPKPPVSTDLNPSRLGLLALVEGDRQDAVGELGVDGLLVDRRGQGEAAEEAAIAPLVQQQVAFLAIAALLGLRLPLGRDGQGLVFEGDVHLVLLEPGQLGLDVKVVGVLADVDAVGRQRRAVAGVATAHPPVEHAVKLPLEQLDRIDGGTANVPIHSSG